MSLQLQLKYSQKKLGSAADAELGGRGVSSTSPGIDANPTGGLELGPHRARSSSRQPVDRALMREIRTLLSLLTKSQQVTTPRPRTPSPSGSRPWSWGRAQHMELLDPRARPCEFWAKGEEEESDAPLAKAEIPSEPDCPPLGNTDGVITDGGLDFPIGDLGRSDDERLPTGFSVASYKAKVSEGLAWSAWRTKLRNALGKRPPSEQRANSCGKPRRRCSRPLAFFAVTTVIRRGCLRAPS